MKKLSNIKEDLKKNTRILPEKDNTIINGIKYNQYYRPKNI